MSDQQNPPNQENLPDLSDEALRKFINIQKEELEIRQREIDQQAQEAEYNYKYSIKALEAQESDLKDERERNYNALNKVLIFLGIIVLLLLIFLGYLVYSGNPELVIEILKALGYIGAGGAGGYGFGYNKGSSKQAKDT